MIISGQMLYRFFQTSVGIVASPEAENSSIILIASAISSFVSTEKLSIFWERVCGVSSSGSGNQCVHSMLAFSSKMVTLFIVARLGGLFGMALLTLFHRLLGDVTFMILFQ